MIDHDNIRMKISKGKVLFIDTTHPVLKEELSRLGFKCEYFRDYERKNFEQIIHEYIGVIIRSKIILDRQILDKATQLKFIGRVGAGMENIDKEFAEKRGIRCYNSPEGSRDAVGEHTVGMLLSLMNHLNRADREVRNSLWRRAENRGIEIKGKTIGIIGYGNMGSAFAQKLKGFGAAVIAYDKYKKDYSSEFVRETGMETIFRETDILSLHVPLTEETNYLIDDVYLGRFLKPIILINTSRGKVVKTEDLVKNMRSGNVIGAALDVLEYEKLSYEDLAIDKMPAPMQYLIKSDRVILTPHIAGWTEESKYKLARVLLDKIINEFDL
jgi:D-3-phosphoglycerate dehydrogenase